MVEELTCMLKCVGSGRRGLGGDVAEWDKQSAVNSSAVEQKFSTNLLDELFPWLSRMGAVEGVFAYCFVAPYCIGVCG